ncbi:MAG TPA: PIN domain nuclease [Epsilonproteobacteria bacterium]|nr:PIN domain nuclease [Campylobacterota bacterium]
MYLIDTSVLIDFFKGKETKQSRKLEKIIQNQIPFGISIFTYQELLQGAKDEKEYETLKRYLSTQKIYYPTHETFDAAAYLFFSCRKQGITIRSTIDTLIATTTIENSLILLCSDRDFEYMCKVVDLEIE